MVLKHLISGQNSFKEQENLQFYVDRICRYWYQRFQRVYSRKSYLNSLDIGIEVKHKNSSFKTLIQPNIVKLQFDPNLWRKVTFSK